MRILITGGCGFIGSAVVEKFIEAGHEVTVIDKLTYAGDFSRIEKYKPRFYKLDIATLPWKYLIDQEEPDCIINLAAETHVDNSIRGASEFIQSNYTGIYNLVCGLRNSKHNPLLIHFSTDEVYGSLELHQFLGFKEEDPLDPRNPYSATKASADLMIQAMHNTYNDFDYLIVRPCNNFGPNQNQEKFIPTIIRHAKENKPVPVYGDGKNVREWLHTYDTADAILRLCNKFWEAEIAEIFNIGSDIFLNNIEVGTHIFRYFDTTPLFNFVEDRPGHDRKYAISCDLLRKTIPWKPKLLFNDSIDNVIKSYL